jgi:uncharacterized protein (DUF1330 family)
VSKGYWIGRIDVHDPEGYKEYLAASGPVFAAHGARFLVRGGEFEAAEGVARARNIVLEFPSFAAAQACYHSAEYQVARAIRAKYSEGEVLLIEGYEGT